MDIKSTSLAAIVLVLSTSANSALVGRLAATEGGTDYQAYYDTDSDLTWLADANYAQTSGFDVDGRMTWAVANRWAAGLNVGGSGNWRLADTLQPDTSCGSQSGSIYYGHDCTGSEMGNLFYNVLGGVAGSSITTTHNANYDLFSNAQSYSYWSATEYALGTNTNNAWGFHMNIGFQSGGDKLLDSFAWAVQSGDVSVSAVPVPPAVWLFGSGLIGLVGFARRKKAS